MDDVKMTGITKEAICFKKVNRNGISSMYNIRYDQDLDGSKATVRRILCACKSCIEQL